MPYGKAAQLLINRLLDGALVIQISKQRVEIAQLLRCNSDDILDRFGFAHLADVRNHCAEMELLYQSGDFRKSCEQAGGNRESRQQCRNTACVQPGRRRVGLIDCYREKILGDDKGQRQQSLHRWIRAGVARPRIWKKVVDDAPERAVKMFQSFLVDFRCSRHLFCHC